MSQAKARIQYRGKEVTVLGGHRAVLDCYKKKMLGQVVVDVEEIEGDNGVVPGSVIDIDSNGEKNVAGYETANINVVPKLQAKTITPTEQQQIVEADLENDGLSKVTVEAIQTQVKTATGNGTIEPDSGKYLSRVYVEVSKGEGANGTYNIYENGTYNIKEFAEAEVNVQPALQEVQISPEEYEQNVTPADNYYGLKSVKVDAIKTETKKITTNGVHTASDDKFFKTVTVDVPIPDGYLKPVGDWNITENGSYDVTRYAKANINVQPALQEKSVTPAASVQEVVADSGVYGLSKVTVNPVPTEEVTITEPVKEVAARPGMFISKVNVNVPTVTVHSGTSEPTNDIGADGDIYLLLEG